MHAQLAIVRATVRQASRLLLLVASVGALFAQTEGVRNLGKAKWRFHTGDNPEWSRPDFDDSKWSLLAGDKSWDEQGYKGYSGFAWYRLRVSTPPGVKLKLALVGVSDAYEVFADGVRIGQFGTLSNNTSPLAQRGAPEPTTEFTGSWAGSDMAIRVWHWGRWAVYHNGGFSGSVLVGEPAFIDEAVKLRRIQFVASRSAFLFVGALSFIFGLFSLLLFLKDRTATEYLWFGVFLVFGLYDMFATVVAGFLNISVLAIDGIGLSISTFANAAMILFIAKFVNRTPGKVAWVYLASRPLSLAVNLWFDVGDLGSIAAWNLFTSLDSDIFFSILIYLVFSRIRSSRAARALALPVSLLSGMALVQGIGWVLFTAGVSTWTLPAVLDQPVVVRWDEVVFLMFLAAMAWILIERFAESRSEQTRLHAELEAAQQVQTLLLDSSEHEAGNLPVKVSYLPAAEVGGDFFRVFRRPDGSAIVLVGDVSGKGLKAAMLVAGIVGALESMVTASAAPGEILGRLNDFLMRKSGEGFVTCICAGIAADGLVAIANAGHLPPYLDGEELSIEGSLPLGLCEGMKFAEQIYRLAPGSQLAFVTDGVVEAMDKRGELFGFERTREIARESPERIAEKARAFGQNDDITVLQVSFAA